MKKPWLEPKMKEDDEYCARVEYELELLEKEELFVNFSLATSTDVIETLNTYVEYFNNRRPAAALQYKSPVQYKIEQGFG